MIPLHRFDLKNSANFHHNFANFLEIVKEKHQISKISIANFTATQPNFVGISQITQKTLLENAENMKKTAKIRKKKLDFK